jgi:DNA repair and recombination RAD54-like protein
MWTLLKQSPHARKPTIEKCIIACPSSLVKNWANELGACGLGVCASESVSYSVLVKWLGPNAICALAIDGKGGKAEMLERVARWVAASGRNVSQPGTNIPFHLCKVKIDRTHVVMIVSYETLRTLTVHLNNCKIGLLLCDEGHRLKNSGRPSPHEPYISTDL